MKYKALYNYQSPTLFFYITKVPNIMGAFCLSKVKKNDFMYMEILRLLNEIRLQCQYYSISSNSKNATYKKGIKVYYKYDERALHIKCKFLRKALRKDYLNFKESIEIHADTSTPIREEKGWCYFSVVLHYEPIYEFNSNRESVTIGTVAEGLGYWNYVQNPHALIVGDTGSGKSVFVRYMLLSLWKYNHCIDCVDGKSIDYTSIRNNFNKYIANTSDNSKEILAFIKNFETNMLTRLEYLRKQGTDNFMNIPSLMPRFLLIDELLVILKTWNKKDIEILNLILSNIILLGRAIGFFLIVTMQRADTKYLSGDLRDNFKFRIALGSCSSSSYGMMFDDTSLVGLSVGNAWYSLGKTTGIIKIPYYENFNEIKTLEEVKEQKKLNDDEKAQIEND